MRKEFSACLTLLALFSTLSFSQVKYDSNGDFGIGTINPLWDLHVDSSSNTVGLINTLSSSSSSYLRLCETTNSFLGGYLRYNASPNTFSIGVHNAYGTNPAGDVDVIKISRSTYELGLMQNVGIGKENPSYKLDLYGSWAQFDYTGTIRFKLLHSDPRICSDNKIVFYNTAQTDWIDIECKNCIEKSDLNSKTNITDIASGLDKVTQLKGVTFNWKDDIDGRINAGLIAQEVEKVIPEVVFTVDSTGEKLISYTKIIPYLVEAIKEQQRIIESLNEDVSALKASNEGALKGTGLTTTESLSNQVEIPVLNQNTPNPFNENTIIKYSIPIIESYAMINVYDLQGHQVKNY